MPDLQSPEPAPLAPVPAGPDAAPLVEEPDYAFGCECADPSLQVAQWLQEARCGGS